MNAHRGRRRLLALATGWLVAAALVAAAAEPARAASATIIERGTQYVPKQVDVSLNDTVVWTFESSPSGPGHTVTFDDGTDLNRNCPGTELFNDCQDTPGEVVQRRFSTTGTYPYYCKIHRGQGMVGVVVVSAATTTSTPTTSTSTTVKASTTTTAKPTSSTTSTTRALATSSTVLKSTTTTADTSSVLSPGEPPPLSGGDSNSNAAGKADGSKDGSDSSTVALIVGLLLAVSAGGGYLLWRLRPGRA
jgi:plastocyanin